MNISGSMLVLLIVYLITKLADFGTIAQLGGSLPQMNIDNKHHDPNYSRQYRELDDVDNVLNRPVKAVNKITEGLQAKNMFRGQELELRAPVKTYLDFMDIMTKETPTEVKVLVEDKQPYFLDEALIIDKYGKKFYWDWRYPKQPISVAFAKDPELYIREHPNEYPGYIIASRNYSNLGPNDNNEIWA